MIGGDNLLNAVAGLGHDGLVIAWFGRFPPSSMGTKEPTQKAMG